MPSVEQAELVVLGIGRHDEALVAGPDRWGRHGKGQASRTRDIQLPVVRTMRKRA